MKNNGKNIKIAIKIIRITERRLLFFILICFFIKRDNGKNEKYKIIADINDHI